MICRRRARNAVLLALLAVAGCAENDASWGRDESSIEPATLSVQLAYDKPRDGCREMTDPEGETVYVSPRVELTQADVADARALKSDERSLLQIVLTRFGAYRLQSVTHAHQGERLAVIIDGKLACAPRIQRAVDGGEIHIVGVYSPNRTAELAEALRPPTVP